MRQSIEIPLNVVSEIALNPVEYEILKIQVLDCRSNETVKNAKIKKLTINGSLTIENVFEQEDKQINTGNKIKDAQEALNRLGYNHGTVATTFGDKGREQYKLYWEDRAPGQVAEITEGNPPDEMLDFIISEYNSHWGTDDNGILNVRIPINTLDDSSLSINLGFFDFPVLLEELKIDPRSKTPQLLPIRREEDTTGNGTNYKIEWRDNQNAEWGGNFGWFMVNGHQSDEFKVSLNLTVKDDKSEFSEFNEDLMSFFYNKGNPSYHLSLFAMQWCQPVWDGIEDGDLDSGESDGTVYVQDSQYSNLNMHIVTNNAGNGMVNNQNIYTYGKTYGTTRHKCNHIYDIDSVDMMTGLAGTIPVFAIHSGLCTRLNGDDTGSYISLMCENQVFGTNNKKRGIRYLHLHSYVIANNTNAMAGQIVGKAGRSGIPAQYPDHCHMDYGPGKDNHEASILNNRDEVDEYNRICIPHYDLPLILPCKSERANSISNCSFDCETAKTCWAAIELKCPALENRSNAANDNQQVRVIQAQLSFLGYYTGELDNGNGDDTKSAITKYKAGNTSGITGNYSFFVDGITRPVSVSTEDEYKINEQTRSEAFDAADEVIYDDRGNLVINDTTSAINDLFLEWLNLEAPLPNYDDNSILL